MSVTDIVQEHIHVLLDHEVADVSLVHTLPPEGDGCGLGAGATLLGVEPRQGHCAVPDDHTCPLQRLPGHRVV